MSTDFVCASRRALLTGAAAGAAVVLAGCQTYGAENAAPPANNNPGGAPGGEGAKALAQTADIPVGGGKVFEGQGVVVTQPTAGTFKAFSATCTHQGCTVASVQGGTINCPCHGSQFAIADGSVASGPATRPLPPVTVTVAGTEIKLG